MSSSHSVNALREEPGADRPRWVAYDGRPVGTAPSDAEASGSSTKNVEPIPPLDSTQMLPPMSRTSSRQM
jgi:hypothetical protein